MDISIMNYATSEVTLITGCPDDWEGEQIENYLYGEDGLNLRESDIYYMVGNFIDITKKNFNTTNL